jgi:predicted RNA-binding Zn-ribbon protein involved in translation (DUF1610 family)
MTDKTICRNDGRCECAIQSGAEGEGEGHCPNGKCAMPASAPGTGSDTLDCILGVGGFASFGPLDAQPAHLTIPGALEWDGDNGTHSADGESRAHSESAPALAVVDESDDGLFIEILYGEDGSPLRRGDKLYGRPSDRGYVSKLAYEAAQKERDDLRAQLANTEQSRRSFFDLSQDLEKRLAERDALLRRCLMAVREQHCNEGEADFDLPVPLMEEIDAALSASAEPAKCESCGGWGHIETEDSAHDCPECGLSLVERAVEAGVMNAPSKPKTCIECDQPYCHGVCVERGDQDYDRDQAAKGGCDE